MGDILGLIVGAVVTLLIFSYLLGDNVLYRWALALLVGTAIGYTTGIAIQYIWNEWALKALTPADLITQLGTLDPPEDWASCSCRRRSPHRAPWEGWQYWATYRLGSWWAPAQGSRSQGH